MQEKLIRTEQSEQDMFNVFKIATIEYCSCNNVITDDHLDVCQECK